MSAIVEAYPCNSGAFVRCIGRWSMTGLMVGNVIGSGIFGVTGELSKLLGRPSPIAMLVAALLMGSILLAVAEVASQGSIASNRDAHARVSLLVD